LNRPMQCGAEFPVCASPEQTGAGAWSCCTPSVVSRSILEGTVCVVGAGDASCPCVGCGDGGPLARRRSGWPGCFAWCGASPARRHLGCHGARSQAKSIGLGAFDAFLTGAGDVR
jgi:hypothetical protein